MAWGRPEGYVFSTKDLVHALFDGESDQAKILDMAASSMVELRADKSSWNAVLWLIMNTLKVDGSPVYVGEELGRLRASLPIEFY